MLSKRGKERESEGSVREGAERREEGCWARGKVTKGLERVQGGKDSIPGQQNYNNVTKV